MNKFFTCKTHAHQEEKQTNKECPHIDNNSSYDSYQVGCKFEASGKIKVANPTQEKVKRCKYFKRVISGIIAWPWDKNNNKVKDGKSDSKEDDCKVKNIPKAGEMSFNFVY